MSARGIQKLVQRLLDTSVAKTSLTGMPARELIESLVSLNLSHKRSFALEIKLDAVGLASKYMKLFTAAVA